MTRSVCAADREAAAASHWRALINFDDSRITVAAIPRLPMRVNMSEDIRAGRSRPGGTQ